MASSDEEGEIIPQCITNYYFVNSKEEPVPFTILPLQWSKDVIPEGLKEQIYFRGTVDNGLQEIYKQAIAWKFELSYVHPEILVLSKGKNWIKLQRPRKSFESIVKNALVTVHCLHLVKKNPEASGESLWNHLLKSFGSFEVKPSQNDLLDHIPLIGEAAKRDKDLEKSKYLLEFILEKSGEKKVPHEDVRTTKNLKFVVDEDDDEDEECDEDANELFDHVCTICDNGGELLCCEGRCMRSFHPTVDSGAESLCESLGFSNTQVDAIQTFLCKNCQYQQHQCFACGMLGSSDKYSGAEVFPCVSATCGHFYHPECVVKLLHPGNESEAEELQNKILAGESFTCPAHKCHLCKQGENKMVRELQFAMCRRCPKAYHRKCLPRKIAFGCDYYKGIIQRAWDDLLPNRILIYCLKHKISPELGTPERNHIIFPDVEVKMKKRASELLSSKVKVVEKNRIMVSKNFQIKKAAVKMPKHVEKLYSTVEDGDSTKKNERRYLRHDFDSLKKRKITDLTTKSLNDNNKSAAVMKAYKSSREDESKLLLRNDELTSLPNMASNPVKPKQRWQNMPSSKIEYIKSAKPVMKKGSSSRPSVDTEMEKRIVALMKKCDSSFNLEEFMEKLKVPSTHSYLSKNVVDKTITLGKVEGSVKAVQAALQKLEGGCSIEDAKAVCEPQVLNQIIKWKRKLSIYLAPFLIGTRYTSFGRHFTKVEKLKEIVDRLHPYVQNGDMIVDFCCGSNDFSCLMKEKLDKMGKKCSFKNFDLFQAKNDFCFEKRDWMSVHSEELPAGSQLIMGLNPPFGAEASLANKFVDKALEFKPKLLILIVPEETKRLDEKAAAYDLIWKDDKILSGKSFYLPGSVDVHDKQLEQWNLKAPPLYLWSHPDWTARHKIIAQKHRHFSKEQEKMYLEVNNIETVVSNYLMEENHDCYADFSSLVGAMVISPAY
ncbi:hypothetical protein L1049_023925 [Liquidambar formosana]|uniref:Zinc finger PHD-type domain-containing protein n=1 Tax=Liquidambar formosana TaxID=63359 RepID=A0AAP0RTM8_LIQFO